MGDNQFLSRRTKLVAGVLFGMLLAASCTGGSDNTQDGDGSSGGAAPATNATLRIGMVGTVDSINPFVGTTIIPIMPWRQVYPYLVGFGGDPGQGLAIEPDYATDWEVSTDKLTWTFTTVAGGKWSDGQPLTAQDAAFTINTVVKYQDGATSIYGDTVGAVASAEAPDDTTLLVHYTSPVAAALENLGRLPIVPEHIWADQIGTNGKGLAKYPNDPPMVNAGAFTWVKYTKDSVALFERNPDFYGSAPKIAGFGIQFFANGDAATQAFKSNEVDSLLSLDPSAFSPLQDAGDNVERYAGLSFNYLGFNSNPNKTSNRSLLDPSVREAIAHAIDLQDLIDVAAFGLGAATATAIPPAFPDGTNPDLSIAEFDTAKSNQILDGLGYKMGTDGIRVASGEPMQFELLVAQSLGSSGKRAADLIKADLQEIGIGLDVTVMDDDALYGAVTSPDGKGLDYDMDMWAWGPQEDLEQYYYPFTCSASQGQYGESYYCNHEFDKIYKESVVEVDPDARLQLLYKMEAIHDTDKPYIVLWHDDELAAYAEGWDVPITINYPWSHLSKDGFLQVNKTS